MVMFLTMALTVPLAVITSTPAAADPTPPLSVKVSFQPAATTTAGYTPDTGAAYSDAAGMGWIRQDSLAGAHVPFALPLNTRDRSACTALPAPQRSFIHMQAPVTNATNNNTPGAWEYKLPNGRYQVSVGVGDPNSGADAERHVLNVEGVRAVNGFPGSTTANCTPSRLKTATVLATVTDGLLTVDAVGGMNTKLSFVTIDSVSVSDVSATPSASGIALNWPDSADATGYRIWRSTNLPVNTTGTPLGTSTASEFLDSSAVKGTSYFYAVATATGAGADNTTAPVQIDDATPVSVPFPAKFDFAEIPNTTGGTNPSVTPAGFIRDYGQNYANVRGYGWITPGTSLPASLVGNGRSRVANSSDPMNSPIHMQGDTVPNFANVAEPGAWQLAVPNGSYDVEVAVGDALPGSDPTVHRINVESVNVINNFTITGTPAGAARFQTGTKTVTVSDGFLTVDAIGGTNTKINYVTVTPTPTDPPPAAPTALVATAGDSSVALDWADNADTDLAGYNVFRGTTATVATNGTPLNGATPVTASAFADTTAVNDTTYFYVVVAADEAGNKSAASANASATPSAANPTFAALPLKINFNDNSTAANNLLTGGIVGDYGQPYTNARGRGWVTPGTNNGLSLVGNGRLRVRPAVTVDPRQQGLMHMQGQDVAGSFGGIKLPGAFEVAVPNGRYNVTASVGDQMGATSYDSLHTVNVEGVKAIDKFQGTAAAEFKTATVTVTVTDGKLTVDATGGTNTKINHLDIDVADVTPPAVPADVTVAAGDTTNTVTWGPVTDTGAVSYTLYAATGDTVALTTENRKYSGTATTFEHTGLANGTKVNYVVTATDAAGNESAGSAVAAGTPQDATAPAAPTGVLALAGDGVVSLRWTANTDADLAGYRIYRSTTTPVALNAANRIADAVTDVEYTDADRVNDTALYYVVTAVDSNGNESVASAEKTATPTKAADVTAPGVPAGLTAVAGDGRVTLTWTANADPDLAGYQVYRSSSAGVRGTPLTTSPVPAATYVDTTAVNGSAYFYVVTAVDVAGNESAASNEASGTPSDTTAPAVPAAVTATAGRHSVTLRWTANTEADLRGYRVYRAETATVPTDDDALVGIVIRPGRTFLDSDLVAGTRYHYVVVSYDALGNRSAASAVVNAVPLDDPDTTAPNTVTGVTATVSDSRVVVGWSPTTAADLAGYNVYRSTTAGGTRVKLTSTPQAGTTYTDLSAPTGVPSFYTVTAVDTAGNESNASAEATVTVPAAGVDVKFVFQPATATVLTGWTPENGAAYSTTRGYGWVRQDTLGTAAPTPLDLGANTRVRTRPAPVTDLQNRAIHLQYGDIVPTPTANGSLIAGAWEYGLPNGRYTVSASVGDQPGAAKTGCAAPCYDSQHTIRAEGVTVINRFQATAAAEYGTGTATVDVVDGKLTIDAVGGVNTKMNWLTIVSSGPVVPDTTAPGAPSGVLPAAANAAVTLTWTAPAATDIAGYHVYRSTTAPFEPTVGNRANTSGLIAATNFTDSGLTNGTRYYYVVTAVDQAGNESIASAVQNAVPTDAAPAALSVKIDYSDATSAPATGYLRDYGQAFGPRSGANQGTGLSYGWLALATDTPTSLEGNGRNRNVVGPGTTTPVNQPDQRLASFVHMQLGAATNGGSITPGKWEMAVPNGAYTVTVAVGDAGVPVDSVNWVNIENQNAVAAFAPTTTSKFATATRTVVVADGRLTLTPTGGTNTKIAYVDIDSLDLAGRPFTSAVNPGNGAVNVVTNASVTADNNLNAETGAVDETTLGGGTVKVTRVADGAAVPGTGATSGGGDTVSFQASAPMAANTLYRFEITADVKDKSGRAFMPFSSVFTTAGAGTGGNTGTIPPNVAFDRVDSGAAKGAMYTSVVMGPDGKLYAGSITGEIYRWTVSPTDGTLSNRQTINTVRTHASTRGWEGAPNRTIIGLTFDPASTATNLILWITDNYAYLGSDVPNATGAVSKLTGPNLENYQEVVVNLPRSIKDHETNSIAFRDGKLYITQGSMNAMGNIDGTWKRAEHLLSAAMLELDPAKLPATLPLDVATPDLTAPARGGVPQHVGTYDPYAAGAPLTLYATGIRNAFDLVWHSNGHLYTGTNGSAAGGSTPATPATFPASCANRPEGGYTGPSAPGIANNQQAETDYIFDVTKGKYYGHPNPVRCEYVLNAGNPTGYTGNPLYKVNQYPLGQLADPNYDLAGVNDAGLHASANGSIEYHNTAAFGGALAGKLITVRYSANQEVVAFVPNPDGSLSKAVTGITGFTGFKQPLDVAENVENGFLYVTELTDNPATTGIQLLKPQGGSGSTGKAEATSRLVFTDAIGGAVSGTQNVAVKNVGGAPLTLSAATITGADAALFARSGGPTLPVTLSPGDTATFPVTFNPTTAGPRGATFSVTTNGPTTPTVSTTLRGLGTLGAGGTNEPSLQWILDTLQIPVNVGDPNPANNDLPASSALIGEEVALTSFTKAAFDHVVEVQMISLFGPNGPTANPNVVTVGVHSTANPAERTTLMRGPNTSNQTVLPTVTPIGEYDLETPFGFDFTWHGLTDRVAYSEDALNTWDATNKHKVRVFQMKNADGSIEPNAYIVAPEDVASPVDFQDAVVIVRNVKPAAVSGAGRISVNPTELVFSGVRGSTIPAKTVTVTNTGTTPLVISDARVSGTNAASFVLTGGPQSIAAGATGTFSVRFAPSTTSTVGYQNAALVLSSDDATRPTLSVGLFGLATTGEQGNNEPPLKAVVDTLGRTIDVGGTGLILGINPSPIGDEVVAPLFVKAGTGEVGITPLARYSPDELLPFGWYTSTTGDAVTHPVATIALDNEQTLNPAIVAGGAASFDPGAESFGIYVDSVSFGRKSYTQDGLNTNIPHAARVYPSKDRTGTIIPNTYLVTFEDAQNGDYQDYVFEVRNVRPASATGSTTPVARIDFAPAAAAVAAGYTADTGAAFTSVAGRGWVIPGTSTPLDMTAQTRDRAGSIDQKLRTLLLMQPTAAQSPNGPGAWEYIVPNGTYVVTVGAGDPGFTDSVNKVQVEGVTALNFTPAGTDLYRTGAVTVAVNDGRLTVDAIGGTNTKIQFIDIDRPSVETDTTAPTVSASLSGLQSSAGVYKNTVDVSVVATDAGSGVASRAYSLDGAAFTAFTTPVTVNTVGAHTLRVRAIDVAGNVATSGVLNFSIVAAGASKAEISLENADGVPFADRLAMNRIQNPETGTRCRDTAACDPVTGPFFPVNKVHDVATLTIRNTGTDPLNITGLPITGPFALVNTTALPALVPVNGTLSVPVRFTATTLGTAGGQWTGTLTVASDDADEPALPVELAGFWQSQSENNQEPNVAELARLFGYGTQITAAGVPLNENGLVHASGDEVLSPYWLRADTTRPVTVRQLAAYHTQGNTAQFRWFVKGTSNFLNTVTHAGVEGQSILPHANGSTTNYAAGTYTPATATTAFGINIDGEWSDPTRNNQTVDQTNGCAGPCGHHVRIWAARDRAGSIMPDTWLVGMDYSGINYDYNDNVYLVTNMKPETAVNPGAPAPLPGAAQLRLDFDTTYPGTLADKDNETTGFVSTQPNKLDLAAGSNSYNKALLDVVITGGGTLAVSSAGTATAGTNGSNDNTLVNGLRLPFDATGGTFTVSGRMLGAVTQFDAGSEQQAVQFGPDQDNFVKVAVINRGGVPGVEFYAEQGGTGVTVGSTVTLANPAAVTSVELALIGTPSARTVKAAYRTNDGAWTVLPTVLTLPTVNAGKFFGTQAQAGILVSHKGGAPLVATFDRFMVDDGDVTTTAPVQEALYRLDVAGAGNYTDSKGAVWTPDNGRFSPATAIAEGATTTPQEIAGTVDDALFRTYRGNVGNVPQAQRVLTYALPTRGATTVDVRLYFAERAAGNNTAGKRLFDISVEGRTVRSNFDIFAAAGGQNTATVLPINDVTVTGGMLELGFSASVDYPSIAAIEVLCDGTCPVDTTAPGAPTGLTAVAATSGVTLDWADNTEADVVGYDVFRSTTATGTFTKLNATPVTASTYVDAAAAASSSFAYQVKAVDSSENISAASNTVTVTTPAPPTQAPIYINTGGPTQTVGGITWQGCTSLTACNNWVSGGNPYSEADTITGIPAGLNNTMFQSEWTGGGTTGARAFGYQIPVLNGSYQVRLYYAELNKTAVNARTFDVRLENTTVTANFDVFQQAGGIDRAIVRSYNATITDGNVTIDFIRRIENAKISAIAIVPVDTTAPSGVTGVTATGVATGVDLGWAANTATDLAGYNVYRSTSAAGTYTRVNTTLVTGTTYADTTAPAGTAFYQVTAVDQAGNESVRSATVSATRVDVTPPAVVTGVTATGSATAVTLGWTASTATDLSGYNVYRSATATGTFVKLNATPLSGVAYADTTAPLGQSFYQVTAVDLAGNESVRSATVAGTRGDTTAPGAVTGVTATGTATAINLSWAVNPATDLAGYNVYASTSATGTYTKLNAAPLTGTTFVDTASAAGVPSFYQVTAIDQAGNESVRSATVSATKTDVTAPNQVTGVTAAGAASGINLGWSASTATDLGGYNVYRSSSATGTFTKVNAALVTGTTYADTAAPAGVASFYQVTAVDRSANESVRSATVSATRPAAPAGTTVRINTGGPAQTVNGVTWSACSSLTACNGWVSGGGAYAEGDTITGIPAGMNNTMFQSEWTGTAATGARAFGFQIPVANGSYQVRLHFAELNKTAAGARTFDVRLENGTVLSNFDVFAQAGGIDRAIVRSFTTTVTDGNVTLDFIRRVEYAKISAIEIIPATVTNPPAAVTGVTAAGVATGINLGWSASTAANLGGYNVYRSASATGTFTKVNTAVLTGTTYADTAAPAGVASFYQVTAVDQAGNESARSATVNATRPASTRPTVRINAGGPAVTTGGVAWSADQFFTGGKTYSNPQVSAIGGTTDDVLYRTERSGASFSYAVPVANGTYDVRLTFAEIYHGATGGGPGGTGRRVFSANIEGGAVELANFDINAAVAPMTAVSRTYRMTITDGVANIAFTSGVDQAKVSGIELLPVG